MTSEDRLENAIQHARDAGLRYVYDGDPGIVRRRRGKGFSFRTGEGAPLTSPEEDARCRKLAIPPAWRNVWICARADGHLQATGIDARGRKQYLYHPDWRAARDQTKFANMLAFGHALPGIRRRVQAALGQDGLGRDKVIAAVVGLLDRTGLRVGNDAYTAENDTFGLTTIRKKHLAIDGAEIALDFPGKGGKVWQGRFSDRRVARAIGQCAELPGYRLFRYLDESGQRRDIGSADVNAWLQQISGAPITAKDFRTWKACALFLEEAMKQAGCAPGAALPLKPILQMVSARLGNTPAILQKSYVHPELIDLHRTGCILDHAEAPAVPGLRKVESLLMGWLEARYGDPAAR